MKTYIPLFLAASLTLVSCETRDQIAGHARVSRINTPTPAPVIVEQPVAPVAAPVPAPLPAVEEPAPAPQPLVAQKQPTPPVTDVPAPTPAPEPKPIVSQQQPAVAAAPAAPAAAATVYTAPKPAAHIASQQQPTYTRPQPRSHVASQQQPQAYTRPQPSTHAASQQQPTYSNSRLPIANPRWSTPQNRKPARRDYPLMPGQNRGLKSRNAGY